MGNINNDIKNYLPINYRNNLPNVTTLNNLNKVAFIIPALKAIGKKDIPLLSWLSRGYADKAQRYFVDPIKQQGFFPGIGSYLKRQVVPVSYSKGLTREAKRLTPEIEHLIDIYSKTDAQKLKLKGLIENKQELLARAQQFRNGGYGRAFKNVFTGKDIGKNLSDIGRMSGHYGMEGLNTAFMFGIPAMGAYSVATAPKGEKMRALAGSMGEMAGLAALTPIGAIPSITGTLGGRVTGTTLYDQLVPKSRPQQFVDKYFPQGLQNAYGMGKTTFPTIDAIRNIKDKTNIPYKMT